MGTNNRSRRATTAEPVFDDADLVPGLLELAAIRAHGDATLAARAFERLCEIDPSVVRREVEGQLRALIVAAWMSGWLPLELSHHVRRTTNPMTARLALVAISADHADRAPSTLDPRWIAQMTELDPPAAESGIGWIAAWERRERVPWRDVVGCAIALRYCLGALTPLPVIMPPPGARASTVNDLRSSTDHPMLERVRALLAQAESTTFDAEAEAFTAKAQELMTRYAIDAAMLSTDTHRSDRPTTIRITIDDPYVGAKSLLLQCVAQHSRCRAVFHQRYALSSVIGLAHDLTATEMLFTSLLVQAQTAVRATAAAGPAGSRARSRAFRSAFLISYAHRVAERLAEINAAVVAEVEAKTNYSIVPVLAARSSAIDAAVDEMFGELRSTGVRGAYDAAGWVSGKLAADRAKLNIADLPASSVTRSRLDC